MNKKQIIGISIFVALIVLIVGIKAVTGSSDDAKKKNLTTVYVATGGGKENFIAETGTVNWNFNISGEVTLKKTKKFKELFKEELEKI